MSENKVKAGLALLSEGLSEDPDAAWTWQCNLACMIMDTHPDDRLNVHQQANERAADFMKRAFGADVTTSDQWKSFNWAGEKTGQ